MLSPKTCGCTALLARGERCKLSTTPCNCVTNNHDHVKSNSTSAKRTPLRLSRQHDRQTVIQAAKCPMSIQREAWLATHSLPTSTKLTLQSDLASCPNCQHILPGEHLKAVAVSNAQLFLYCSYHKEQTFVTCLAVCHRSAWSHLDDKWI